MLHTSLGCYIENWLYNIKYGTIKNSSFDRLEATFKDPILPEMGMIRLEQHGVYYGDKFLVRARFRYPEVEYGREL